MKKINYITLSLVLLIGIIGYTIFSNRVVSTITLDINPSILIKLKRNNKIQSVTALNSDAEVIISSDLKRKSLDDALKIITDKVLDNGYATDNQLLILVNSTGKISNEQIVNTLNKSFNEKDIMPNFIIIENTTKEDRKMASKYNITPAKAAYINTIVKEKKSIPIESLIDKSISELREAKEFGRYCDSGYTLEGTLCIKEIGKENASYGKVCAEGYLEFNGKCYKETRFIEEDEYECPNDFKLTADNKCIGAESIDAIANFNCASGDLIQRERAQYKKYRDAGDGEQYVCEDKSKATAPTLRCLTINHTMINGKCADGPKPTINGRCEAGDYLVNGGCYTMDKGDQWVCPNGDIYEKSKGTYTELCPDTFKYTTATGSYSCEQDYTLKGNKCTKEIEENARPKRTCISGYTLIDGDRCIDYTDTKEFIDGYYCDSHNSKLKDNQCIIIETIEANIE